MNAAVANATPFDYPDMSQVSVSSIRVTVEEKILGSTLRQQSSRAELS